MNLSMCSHSTFIVLFTPVESSPSFTAKKENRSCLSIIFYKNSLELFVLSSCAFSVVSEWKSGLFKDQLTNQANINRRSEKKNSALFCNFSVSLYCLSLFLVGQKF